MTNAIVGIDLADRKQMVVVCDHDSRVLARRDVPVQGVGPGCRPGLGCRPGDAGWVCWGDGGV